MTGLSEGTARRSEVAAPEPGGSGAAIWQTILHSWRAIAVAMLVVLLPLLVVNRFELPLGISFGFRSFARNTAIFMVLGVWLKAVGLPRPRSSLTVPFLFLGCAAWLSVSVADGRWADVRSLGFTAGLFYGARSLASAPDGRRLLFHWLGLLTVFTVAIEIYRNPAILQFRESLRNTMVTAHPNTLGGFFAVLAPVFLGTLDDKSARRMAPVYFAAALLGAFMTFSRLSMAGLFLGAGTVLLASWLRRHPVRVAALGATAAIVGIGLIVYMSSGRAEADWQRLRIIHASLTLFAEHPIFGVGWGVENLEVVFPPRYQEMFGSHLWLYHSHNMYVDVLVGGGLVAGACATWFFFRLVGAGWTAFRSSQDDPRIVRVGSGFLAMVVVFLWLGVGDMPLYHERLMFPLALAWGLMDGWANRAHTRPS